LRPTRDPGHVHARVAAPASAPVLLDHGERLERADVRLAEPMAERHAEPVRTTAAANDPRRGDERRQGWRPDPQRAQATSDARRSPVAPAEMYVSAGPSVDAKPERGEDAVRVEPREDDRHLLEARGTPEDRRDDFPAAARVVHDVPG